MNARHLLAAPLVAAAMASPFLAKDATPGQAAPDAADRAGAELTAALDTLAVPALPASVVESEAPLPPLPPAQAETPASNLPPFDTSRAQFAGGQVSDFAEVLRFDISPEWVFTRWSRVSTVTDAQALQGFRVPLITGTRVDDVAGVATYYFGRYGYLQRIAFEGRCGDTRRLVAFLSKNYAFKSEPNLGAGMYLVRWNAKPMSALRVAFAPVVRADAPHERYTLQLEINRPDESYHLSNDFRDVLSKDRDTQRWLPF